MDRPSSFYTGELGIISKNKPRRKAYITLILPCLYEEQLQEPILQNQQQQQQQKQTHSFAVDDFSLTRKRYNIAHKA